MLNRPWEVEESEMNMKTKTMLAIAALSATMVIQAKADGVVSSSVVGYSNIGLLDGGYKMVGATFTAVGTNEVKLSELKVTGYENNEFYLGEMGFTASFQLRASNGMPYATYVWSDESLDMETWEGGKWVNSDTGADVTSENDVMLKPGDGLWFSAPELQGSTAFKLTTSGAVLKGDQGVELNAGGYRGICNLMPSSVKLSEVEVQGYEDNEFYLGEMGFTMSMQSLLPNGMPSVTYVWSDESLDMETWEGGKWINSDTGADITSENDVTITAGEGFWATAPSLEGSECFSFVLPKVLE